MQVKISSSKLSGRIKAIPSKSMMHRALITASLAKGTSKIENIIYSKDIIATIDALRAIGAKIDIFTDYAIVEGVSSPNKQAKIDCNESGSTLRFLIPVAAALGINAEFFGKGKLPTRPIDTYINAFSNKNVVFNYENTMPFSIEGKLFSGDFLIDGNISSQFITGLLFALPLLDGESNIKVVGELESKPYIDLTIEVLNAFGINIIENENGYTIKGNQQYKATDYIVEGDYSQAAFFLVGGAFGEKVEVYDLNPNSKQGDKAIVDILKIAGANVEITADSVIVSPNQLNGFNLSVKQIPDLLPIVSCLAAICDGKSKLYDAERLKIKESDRLVAMATGLNKIGAKVVATDDSLEIKGVKSFSSNTVDSFNDHRIAMSLSICTAYIDGELIINNAQCVEKSYPNFFEDFNKIGGKSNVIDI